MNQSPLDTQEVNSLLASGEARFSPLPTSLRNDALTHYGMNKKHAFKTLIVSSDSHVACLGAHKGEDGAIVIAGTGVVGYQIYQGETTQVGGWGFPHDDEGGGAWLGLQAIRQTFQWLDGRAPSSGLTQAIFAYFNHDQKRMISWANLANSTIFAELAPLVVQQSEQGDEAALVLLKSAAQAIDRIGQALWAARPNPAPVLPCSLLGGVATFITPFLSETLQQRLRSATYTPVMGAILLVRKHLNMQPIYG